MNQIELNVSEVTGRAWELAKKHGIIIAGLIFVSGMISGGIQNLGFPWQSYFEAIAENDADAMLAIAESAGGFSFLQILSSIITIVITAGIMNSVILLTCGKMGSFDIAGFKMPVMNYVNYFVVSLLGSILIVIGCCLCLIPGIFIAVRLIFANLHILAHPEDGISGAFEKSWKMTKGNFWNLFLLGVLAVLICIGGFMCCCIGVYFAGAMIYFMMAVAYFTLADNTNDTPTGTDDNTSVEVTAEAPAETEGYVKTY